MSCSWFLVRCTGLRCFVLVSFVCLDLLCFVLICFSYFDLLSSFDVQKLSSNGYYLSLVGRNEENFSFPVIYRFF